MAASTDPTQTSMHTPVGSSHVGRPSLMARYGSLADVRHAIETLEGQGIDGDRLSLVGPEGTLPGGTDRRRLDSRFLSRTMLFLTFGVLGGALAGAALGAVLIGLVVLLWSGLDASGWVFLLLTVWFGVGGAVLGGFFAISRVIGFSESWNLTFEDEPHAEIWLGIFEAVDDPALVASQTNALEITTEPRPVQTA